MQVVLPSHVVLRPLNFVTLAMLGVLSLGLMAASTQAAPRARSQAPAETDRPADPAASHEALKQHEQELEALRAEQRKTIENEARLKREIESIADDRRKFNQQIIDTASRVVSVEERIGKTQERLASLDGGEQAMRASLEQRRGVIAEVLAALQRIGRQAPPALMIRAEDALQSVRSAMMLGAVLPEMRHQVETLAADLAELVRLRKQIKEERDILGRDLLVLTDDRQRLSLLIEERQKRQAEAEQALTEERQRAAQLARQAENLNQLIVKLEPGLETAARSAAISLRRRTSSARSPASASAWCRISGSTAPSIMAERTDASASSALITSAGGGCRPMRCNAARISAMTSRRRSSDARSARSLSSSGPIRSLVLPMRSSKLMTRAAVSMIC
jgi:septal ring factor EnvC (AmiA/AmiB activator)